MRRWAVLVAVALTAGALLWRVRAGREFVLPGRLHIEQTVVDFGGRLAAETVVAQRPGAPVRIGGIRPGRNTNPNSGYRTALVAAAPSLLRYRVAVPEHASLRFGLGVQPPDDIDPSG